MDKRDLVCALCEVDNGRFEDIIHVIKFTDSCAECDHFNLSINDWRRGYRCKCMPLCAAATLSKELISYLNWKLNWIDERQHLANLGIT